MAGNPRVISDINSPERRRRRHRIGAFMTHKIGHGGTHFTSWAQNLRSVSAGATVPSIAYSSNTKRLAIAIGERVLILDAKTLAKEYEAPHGAPVRGVTFAGSDVAVATVGDDGFVRVFQFWSAAPTTLFEAAGEDGTAARSVAYCSSGPLLAVGYANGTAKVFSCVKDGGCIATLRGHDVGMRVLGVEFSRDGKLMASACEDGTARVWSTSDGDSQPIAVLKPFKSAAGGPCTKVRFGSVRTSGMVVVATASGHAHVFHLPAAPGEEPVLAHTLKGHAGGINDLAIGENGEVLATASQDKSIRLWTLRDGQHARALPGGGDVLALSFSTSGSANLACATAKGTIKIFGIVPRGAEAGLLVTGGTF